MKISVGDWVEWNVEPPLKGFVTQKEYDEDGDLWYHLSFKDHKDVRVEEGEVKVLNKDISWHEDEISCEIFKDNIVDDLDWFIDDNYNEEGNTMKEWLEKFMQTLKETYNV